MKARLGIFAVLFSLLLVSGPAGASVSNDQVQSRHIREADGTSGQDTNSGAGVKTGHIQNGAVTTPKIADGAVTILTLQNGAVTAEKLGIVCPDDHYLKYTVAGGWTCSVGTPGPEGPQGPAGPQGDTGAQGPAGPTGPMPHYAQVIVVAKEGGDYSDLSDAMDSITNASASNRYLIKIMPGVYEEEAYFFFPKSYVDMEGSGTNLTKITSNSGMGGIIPVLNYANVSSCELRDLAVEHMGTADQWGILVYHSTVSFRNIAVAVETVHGWESGGFWVEGVGASASLKDVSISVPFSTGAMHKGVVAGQGSTIKMLGGAVDTPGSPAVYIFGGDFRGSAVELGGLGIMESYAGGTSKCVSCYDTNFDPVQ